MTLNGQNAHAIIATSQRSACVSSYKLIIAF